MRALDEAIRRLNAGDPEGAHALLEARVQAEPEGTLGYAQASEDLATLALAAGNSRGALEALRDAVRVEVVDDRTAAIRSRCLLQLSELLASRGEATEAEATAWEAVALTRAGSVAVAKAQATLARLLLERGQPAAELARAALGGLWGQPEGLEALILDALAATAAAGESPLELYLDALPDPGLDEVVRVTLTLAARVPAAPTAAVVLRLASYLQARRSPVDPDAIDLLTAATNLGRSAGDPAGWTSTYRALIATLRRAGRGPDAVRATLGLASACLETGDAGAAEITYEAALRDAERVGDPWLTAEVLRAMGLFLAGSGRVAYAEPVLVRAVTTAGSGVALGRSLVAYGLVLAHAGRDDEARGPLEQAVRLLSPDDRDALTARIHLDALGSDRSCGCGSAEGVTGSLVRLLVLRDAPKGLLDDVVVDWRDGKPHVRLVVLRDPADGELEAVDATIRGALVRLGSGR